jgi:arabinan endo-1,5-alpha-L-arabinosidase
MIHRVRPSFQQGFARTPTASEAPDQWEGAVVLLAPFLGRQGGQLYELSGCTEHGTLTNGPVWVGSQGGYALKFDGTNDYVLVPSTDSVNVAGDLTMTLWLKVNVAGHDDVLLSKEGVFGVPYYVGIANSGTPHWLWYHHTENGDFSTILTFTGHVIPLGRRMAVSFTRRTANQSVTLAVDGRVMQTLTYTTDPPQGSAVDLRIGGDPLDRAGRFLDGQIEQVRFYNRALTAADVAAHARDPYAMWRLRRTRQWSFATVDVGPPIGSLQLMGVGR